MILFELQRLARGLTFSNGAVDRFDARLLAGDDGADFLSQW